jgi:hypothetical protein
MSTVVPADLFHDSMLVGSILTLEHEASKL